MNLVQQFKRTFSYTWYLYVFSLVLPLVAFPVAFSFAHRPQEYEKLSIFVPVVVSDNILKNTIENEFKDKGVKSVDVVSIDAYDNPFMFSQKLNVVGVTSCDILILPEDKISELNLLGTTIDLNDEIKEACKISDEEFYKDSNLDYGVKLSNSNIVKNYVSLKTDKNYYAFLGAQSWNVGKYSMKDVNTSNAFDLMAFLLGK